MKQQSNIKLLLYGLVATLLIGSAALFWQLGQLVEPTIERTATDTETTAQTTVEPVRVEARWLLAGEVFWGRRMERDAMNQPNPYQYLFSRLDTFEREKYDAWLAQLECPITDEQVPFSTQAEDLIFNCRPEYVPELAKWFDALSLATNHTDNVGAASGLAETRENLRENDIQFYGHFDNGVRDDICEVAGLPARVVFSDGTEQPATMPVALCGYNNVFRLPSSNELDQIERYSEHFYTIVSPHQGVEYEPTAGAAKRRTYRAMVDRGADLVVGSHPHWVQDTESYKGKLIMYSVGNFMFDQEWSEETKRGVALDLILSAEYTGEVQSMLELGPQCVEFKDDCLAATPSKPDTTSTYELVSSLHENALTRKAPETIHALNLQRTDWEATRIRLNPHD